MGRWGGFRKGRKRYTFDWDDLQSATSKRLETAADTPQDFSYVEAQGVWTLKSTMQFPKSNKAVIGQAEYTTPGTYFWTAPSGITSVCVVAVGGGGGGGSTGGSGGAGGGGGGLGWKNDIPVVPGNSYTVVVGDGGDTNSTVHGEDSYFIDTSTVCGFGGQSTNSATGAAGGSYAGDGGGNGGSPDNSGTADSTEIGRAHV